MWFRNYVKRLQLKSDLFSFFFKNIFLIFFMWCMIAEYLFIDTRHDLVPKVQVWLALWCCHYRVQISSLLNSAFFFFFFFEGAKFSLQILSSFVFCVFWFFPPLEQVRQSLSNFSFFTAQVYLWYCKIVIENSAYSIWIKRKFRYLWCQWVL